MNKLAPSILAADFSRLGEEILEVSSAGAEYLHIDVMDGSFVPSISVGLPVIEAIRPITDMTFDVHLMINEPDRYIDDFIKAGANILTVHAEACRHLNRTLYSIKERGIMAGVALNPATPLSVLDYIYEYADLILIMSVNPGFGGQQFIPETLKKLHELRSIVTLNNIKTEIEVDGGITLDNVRQVISAGAQVIVSGSSIFGSNAAQNVRKFKEVIAGESRRGK